MNERNNQDVETKKRIKNPYWKKWSTNEWLRTSWSLFDSPLWCCHHVQSDSGAIQWLLGAPYRDRGEKSLNRIELKNSLSLCPVCFHELVVTSRKTDLPSFWQQKDNCNGSTIISLNWTGPWITSIHLTVHQFILRSRYVLSAFEMIFSLKFCMSSLSLIFS